jgi:hypothetical protein
MTVLPGVNRTFSLNSALRYLNRNYNALRASEQATVLPQGRRVARMERKRNLAAIDAVPDAFHVIRATGQFTDVISSTLNRGNPARNRSKPT